MNPYRISLTVFGLTMGGFFLGLSVLCHSERMPGPRISDSVSFNQKALWLRKYFQQHNSVQIVIVGSSMGLNNVDGEELGKDTGTASIINGSSWGLDVTESAKMARLLVDQPVVAPRLVIIPVFFGDFTRHQEKNLNWTDFRECLSSPFLVPLYLADPDYGYYLETYRKQAEPKAMARQVSDSLQFDAYGGVPLSCDFFEYLKLRWDRYQNEKIKDDNWDPDAIQSLLDLATYLKTKKIGLILLVCPMRQVAEKKLGATLDSLLWHHVQSRITASGITFIHVTGDDFGDSLFADSYHLNQCGARELARRLAPQINPLLNDR